MPSIIDQHYLQTDQYRDASSLGARAQLHRRFSTNRYGWQRWIFDQLNLPAKCALLDVGCGAGCLWSQNLRRIPGGWEVVLSDFSPGILQEARQNLSADCHNFGYGTVDAQFIPFADESFDAVIANQVLYHVPNRDRTLLEIRRVLRPGGHLYAATVGHDYLRGLREMMAKVGVDASAIDAASEFGLENGMPQLSRFYDQLTLYRYEEALIVTEVKPLLAYALSTICATALRQNLGGFVNLVEQELTSKGAIHLRKDSGMSRAVRA